MSLANGTQHIVKKGQYFVVKDEIRLNIIEPLADTIISIAHANSDFVCTDCLGTLSKLKNILGYLDGKVWAEVVDQVDEIVERSW